MSSDEQPLKNKQELVEWRYSKEIELASKGANQSEIAQILKLNKSTISRDFKTMRRRAAKQNKDYIEKVLPFEVQKTAVGINEAIKQAWAFALDHDLEPARRIQALSMIPDAQMKRLAVLGDPVQLEAAIKLVQKLSGKKDNTGSDHSGDSSGPDEKEEVLQST